MTERLGVQGAVRVFGDEAGLFGVDLTVAAGQVHAVVGLNGAGKTTLLGAILGMLALERGQVRIHGTPLSELPNLAWRGVGHLVHAPFAYPELDTAANLTLSARLRGVAREAVPRTVAAALAELGLERYARVPAKRLSQGNRQRLGLAAALQHHPDLIVLDEPTNTLDPAGMILLREALLRRVRAGAGALVSSHHLDEVARIADRISVLNYGRVIGTLDPHSPDPERAFFDLVLADDERRNR